MIGNTPIRTGFFVALMAPMIAFSADKVPCADIQSVDFKNINLEGGIHTLDFKNGVALEYYIDKDITPNPEWQFDLVKESMVTAVHGPDVKFLEIYGNHLGGAGSKEILLGYICKNKKVEKVFDHSALSQTTERLDAKSIEISLVPQEGNPKRKHYLYVWDGRAGQYVRNSTFWE